jgi:hypothetical protein
MIVRCVAIVTLLSFGGAACVSDRDDSIAAVSTTTPAATTSTTANEVPRRAQPCDIATLEREFGTLHAFVSTDADILAAFLGDHSPGWLHSTSGPVTGCWYGAGDTFCIRDDVIGPGTEYHRAVALAWRDLEFRWITSDGAVHRDRADSTTAANQPIGQRIAPDCPTEV